MDVLYRKENGICQQCTEKAYIEGLCMWHYQFEYGRRENVKAGNRIEAEKKAIRPVLPVRKSSAGEISMSLMLKKSRGEQKAVCSTNDAGRKRKDVSKRVSKTKARKRYGCRNKS